MTHTSRAPGSGGVWNQLVAARNWKRGLAAGALSALAIGLPTDVIGNPLFTRMTAVRWWDYPILAATAILTALWAALPGGLSRSGYRASGASVLGALAVGCPVCNKLVVAMLGLSGALAIWAPLQPLLGVASVCLILLAVLAKRRPPPTTCPTSRVPSARSVPVGRLVLNRPRRPSDRDRLEASVARLRREETPRPSDSLSGDDDFL